jgi:dipeptidyl aminopeptidase/acylaminoacyl peptidase
MKKFSLALLLLFPMGGLIQAQEKLEYQKPSQEILELVDVPLAPSVRIDHKNEYMVLLYRDAFKTIDEISKTELRLGGLRIDPATNIGSRMRYYNKIEIKSLIEKEGVAKAVKGLPEKPLLANFSWSPDQQKMAFTQTTSEGVELWVLDITSATAKKLTEAKINANLGDVINWFEDSQALLVKILSGQREELIDTKEAVPAGPTISVADGKKAQNRTYQDLLQNPNDEHNFEQLALSEIHKISLDGTSELWMESAMYDNISFSPDGRYVIVSTINKPFSYLVPYYRFPSVTTVYTMDAEKVETVLEVPLIEDLPKGFMAVRKGRRNLSWRNDKAASLVFVEALDEGDPENEVEYRDKVYQLDAPFNGTPVPLLKTVNRFAYITWGSEDVAIATDRWWNTRNQKTYVFNPSDPGKEPVILFDRNYQDRYNDPGIFVTKRNEYGSHELSLKKDQAYLIGSGYSKEGQFPFLDQLDLESGETKRIYQSEYTDRLENLWDFDVEKKLLLVRIESPTEFPNIYFRDLKKKKLTQITAFENPYKSIQSVHKEVISYKRDDGLELSGTLYLPVGYDMEKKEKAPMILWAYPREYKDKASAGQRTANPNRFTAPNYGSAIFWVAKGYVVLDGAAFPIVGEGEEEPNDHFRKQLVANGKAAIDAVDALGYIDRSKVAVGGHSYGAFMVANLLSHSDLFAAGIARSGAYNRTLTPFGFQSEERTYWEAPEVYYTMSPFMHADKMKTPLLLIHGEADNNSGTYPLQSTRYFNALKGLGATVRLVMLPKESHGYAARESILHMLWEQDQWLEKYVK